MFRQIVLPVDQWHGRSPQRVCRWSLMALCPTHGTTADTSGVKQMENKAYMRQSLKRAVCIPPAQKVHSSKLRMCNSFFKILDMFVWRLWRSSFALSHNGKQSFQKIPGCKSESAPLPFNHFYLDQSLKMRPTWWSFHANLSLMFFE